MNPATLDRLFTRDEKWLLERMQERGHAFVAVPERIAALKDLERRGYCTTVIDPTGRWVKGSPTPAGLCAKATHDPDPK